MSTCNRQPSPRLLAVLTLAACGPTTRTPLASDTDTDVTSSSTSDPAPTSVDDSSSSPSTTESTTSTTTADTSSTAVDTSSTAVDTSSDSSGDIPDTCGDGTLDDGEECDLGTNNSDNAGCTSACALAICGDGLLYIGREDCDDGNALDTDACLSTCVDASCGDGLLWEGTETCDTKAVVPHGTCNACVLTCNDTFSDCDQDGLSCELELCGGTCNEPGPPGTGMILFEPTGAVEEFIVPPCVTTVMIEAWGAQGGDNITVDDLGGRGARMFGEFAVSSGESLSIVVGTRGDDANQGDAFNGSGGGGGGSFVWRTANDEPLLIAGGGGGSSLTNEGDPHFWGKDGVVTEDATGSRSHDQFGDAPGGVDGGDGNSVSGSGGNGWFTVLVDPAGQPACEYGGNGGFGGGGGSGCAPNICNPIQSAGGGGGYSGGGAGGSCYFYGGGGGGSLNTGVNQDNGAGVQEGDGAVLVSW